MSPLLRACKEQSVAGKEPGPDKARSQGRHTVLKLWIILESAVPLGI